MGAEVVREAAVKDWAEEVEVTLLSVVVMHLADSQGVASVRDSGGCQSFPLVAEMMIVSGIATLGTMGIFGIGTKAIIAISSAILISLPSVFLIGGTLTTDTATTEIPTKMRTMIQHRLTVTSIGKIWR